MRTVYKYPIELKETRQTIIIPDHSIPRHVGFDPAGQPCVWCACVWCEIDTEEHQRVHELYCLWTGEEHPDLLPFDFIGTIIDGNFVYHLYLSRLTE